MRRIGQKAMAAGLVLGLAALAGGCTSIKDHRGYLVDNTLVDSVQPGVVMLRMEREEALITPSVRLTELFVDDMDGQLRQSGVGDLVVGKRMGKLMGVLGGRLGALREAFAAKGPEAIRAALVPVLERNVTLIEDADKQRLAVRVMELADQLNATSGEDILAGRITR